VAAPSIELTMQDLYDTLRSLAAEVDAIDEPEIIEGVGKSLLGPGRYTGLTITLLNAKVGFEARAEWTYCSLVGGNLVAFDAGGSPISPIQPTTFVNVGYESDTSAALLEGSGGVTAEEVANAVWDELASGHVIPGSYGDLVSRILNAVEVKRGTVQDDGATVMKFLTDLNETANGFWDRCGILMFSGQCKGQIRGIKNYNGNTKEVTVETPFSYAPARNDQFILITPRKYLAPNLEDIGPIVRTELTPELAEIDSLESRLTEERAGYLDIIPSIDVPPPSEIAGAVMDEPLSGHQISGSFGFAMFRLLGLAHENFRLKDQVYDDNGNLISATVRIYGNGSNAQDDVNPIAEYLMAATFDAAKCTSYLMKAI